MLRFEICSRVRLPTEVNREDKHRIRADGKPGWPIRGELGEMPDVDAGVDTKAPEGVVDGCCEDPVAERNGVAGRFTIVAADVTAPGKVLRAAYGPGNLLWVGRRNELASINLKREAFEKWRTGYSSAYAVILFVTVFGLASIYVKALNKVKQR